MNFLNSTFEVDKYCYDDVVTPRDLLNYMHGTRYMSSDNSVSSKKRMTFREEVAKLHPENIDHIYVGGVLGCPRDPDTCPYLTDESLCPSENDCRACWDREIPDELMGND